MIQVQKTKFDETAKNHPRAILTWLRSVSKTPNKKHNKKKERGIVHRKALARAQPLEALIPIRWEPCFGI
uniref:Uncharacterized protein n=1 Tax=Salix viminalis TaxID=40686 RepID=A0A6N2LE05_SALVM